MLSFLAMIGFTTSGCGENPKFFAGGYAKGEEKGMFVYELDKKSGSVKLLSQADAGPNPSYFCYSPENKLMYAANEVGMFLDQRGGGLTTLRYNDNDATLDKISEMVVPFGGPCYISISPDKGYLFLANYGSGSVAVVRLNDQGIPETVTDTVRYMVERPFRSNPHMVMSDPLGNHIFVTDLGQDRFVVYEFDAGTGKLNQVENGVVTVEKGSGPRHFTFSADASRMYLINELGSTMMTFSNDHKGNLTLMQTVSTRGFNSAEKNYPGDAHAGKNGEYIYGSNRGENSIVIYKVADDGTLNLAGHTTCGGDWPRNFVIDPSGEFLLVGNQRSDNIAVFKINKKTGMPEGPVENVVMQAPACLKFF